MTPNPSSVPLPGSNRNLAKGAREVAVVPPDQQVEVTVRLRRRKPLPSPLLEAAKRPQDRKYLTLDQLESEYGADPKDVALVEAFARQHGLKVVEASAGRRSVTVSGTADAFRQAFGVDLKVYEHATGNFRSRTGPLTVPPELANVIEGVFGFDTRPVARPHFRRIVRPQPHDDSAPNSLLPTQMAKLYNFPSDVNGSTQCIALIELGGGYHPTQMQDYFLHTVNLPKTPKLVDVPVGAKNSPGSSADVEVALDIAVAGAIAPGATIAVYFTPNDNKHFLKALTTAIHDSANKPSVISISWGYAEIVQDEESRTWMNDFNAALESAAAIGTTVCIAAGDNGAADYGPLDPNWEGAAHADFPASSPFALACGGTTLSYSGTTITSETVWNDGPDTGSEAPQYGSFRATGGGISDQFDVPAYQSNAGVPKSTNLGGRVGRGVPDVAGCAGSPGFTIPDPDPTKPPGSTTAVGGTSAVAPLWAALIALINQKLGYRVGMVQTVLYNPANAAAFNDVTGGDNRVSYGGVNNLGYDSGPGWDACTGLGTPNGQKILEALS